MNWFIMFPYFMIYMRLKSHRDSEEAVKEAVKEAAKKVKDAKRRNWLWE